MSIPLLFSSTYNLHELIQELNRAFKPGLTRLNMELDYNKVPPGLSIHGKRHTLVQVLFNLITNSRDAQKTKKKERRNIIRIAAREDVFGETRKVVITFTDDGPGINRSLFPDPSVIFDFGKSSKTDTPGSGMGLTISRHLLTKHYSADLDLINSFPATFQITIPQ